MLAPADGWVVYAGPFRSYGQVLILNAGDGYHIVLAGMERIDAALGQFVLGGRAGRGYGRDATGEHRGHRPYFCPADSLCRVPEGWKLNQFSALVGAYGWRGQRMMRRFTLLAAGAVFGALVMGGVAQFGGVGGATAAATDTYRQLNLFGDVFERIRSDYVEEPDDAKLIEAAINGMLSSLDPHSSYLNAKDYQDMQVQTRGEFFGLGIEVTMENELIKVISPIDDTPAFKAGILAGDLITQLDGEPVQGLTLREAVEKMRGPANSSITLTVVREGEPKPLKITVVRDVIRVQSVKYRVENDIGYIRIASFSEQTMEGLEKAIDSIQSQVPAEQLKGFVLDLRGNPGGLLDQAVLVSDAFLDRGRDRLDARPPRRRSAALQRAGRRPHQRQAAHRASQRRLRLGVGNRRRRAAGPSPRDAARHALVRQGIGADDHPDRPLRRDQADDRALLHAVRPLHPGQGDRPRHRGAAGAAEGHPGLRHRDRGGAPRAPSWRRREDSAGEAGRDDARHHGRKRSRQACRTADGAKGQEETPPAGALASYVPDDPKLDAAAQLRARSSARHPGERALPGDAEQGIPN